MNRRTFLLSMFILQQGTITAIPSDSAYWNPYNKVFQDHRDGTIIPVINDMARATRGLPTPWAPEMAEKEVSEPPVP